MRKILIILMVAAALSSAGCKSNKPKPSPSSQTEVGGADSAGAGSDAANAGNVGSDDETAGPQGGLLAKRIIYFDFDSSDIKGEGTDVVAAHAKYLASHAGTRVRLEVGQMDFLERSVSLTYRETLGTATASVADDLLPLG